jgi:hypothetical protein
MMQTYLLQSLEARSPSRFKIVAFVDKNNQNSSKRMLDLPIQLKEKNYPP